MTSNGIVIESGTEKAFPVNHVPEGQTPGVVPGNRGQLSGHLPYVGGAPSAAHQPNKENDFAIQEIQEDETKVKEPRKFAVILHNDDYTTMDFVIEVLGRFFGKTQEEAVQIMLQVHNIGRGICGAFTHEIAETKVMQVHEYAKYNGFPLKCSMEPL